MERLFTSFNAAWRFFLDRREDLDDFFASFPEQDHFVLAWLLQLDAGLVPAVRRTQAAFSHLDWITPQPGHFLHVSLAGVAGARRLPSVDEIKAALEPAEQAWRGAGPFEVCYRRFNCFHSAVVIKVEGNGPRALASKLVEANYWHELPIEGALPGPRMNTFLAHLTIGTVNAAHDPAPLREVLISLRDANLGRQRFNHAALCVVPASRTTILDPWQVVGSVAFSQEHEPSPSNG